MSNSSIERNSRLLVIDDNSAIHDDFRKVLSPKQMTTDHLDAEEAILFGEQPGKEQSRPTFQIDSAFQGQEGLELVRQALARRQPYAMAFVDVRMPPGWDGIETTAKIWEMDPDLQIVICTAYSDYSWDDMLAKLGQSDRLVILKKPFDNIEVVQLASSLTRKWQLLQESKRKVGDLEQLIVSRTAQMEQEQEKFKSIFENSPDGIFQTDKQGNFICANPALAGIYGYASAGELSARLDDHAAGLYVEPGRREEWKRRMEQEKIVREFESEIRCPDGTVKWISETACRVTAPDGSVLYYQGFVVDITEEKIARRESRMMEAQLRQAQKLESVGQLAAGIAHEINTPIQYIGDNIRFVEESFSSLQRLLTDYQALAAAVQANAVTPDLLGKVEASGKSADIEYINREIPQAVRQSLEGVNHVARIVLAMKEFSHPGTVKKIPTDLNHALETVVLVARNEWKYVAELVNDFDPNLPLTPCLAGEFNQVVLNLIVNAAQAIGDVVKHREGSLGTIKITTRLEGPWSRIEVSDTGTGIPEEIRRRIFEPFFTTKEVGKGSGQGLAIAHATIVKKHGGQLYFESAMGNGTTFIIRLPHSPAEGPLKGQKA